MDIKKHSNLSLILLGALFCCVIIPIGLKRDWEIIEYVIILAVSFITVFIYCWNAESAQNIGCLSFLCYLMMFFGLKTLLGDYGDGLLLRVIGAVTMILGAVLYRLCIRYESEKED